VDPKSVFAVSAAYLAPYHLPFGQFDHQDGKAISGGYVYRGPLQILQGKYIFGDIVTGRLFYMNMDQDLNDHAIYELKIMDHGKPTSVAALTQHPRTHLRIGYDEHTGDLFIMTKADSMIRRISKAWREAPPATGS
jgi:hypothetical protein